jgi:hypothetical protein
MAIASIDPVSDTSEVMDGSTAGAVHWSHRHDRRLGTQCTLP